MPSHSVLRLLGRFIEKRAVFLNSWYSDIEMTTAERTVRRMVSLDEAALEIPRGRARRNVEHVADDLAGEVRCVSKAVAARVLGLSTPTVDTWIGAGRLHAVVPPGSTREYVEVRQLSRVAALVRFLRSAGRKRGVIAAVIDRLSEDDPGLQRELTEALEESLAAVDSGDLVELTLPASFGSND